MKGMRGFLIFIVLLFVVVFSIELSQRKKFVWLPTYAENDYHPFGSAIFDDVMKASLPNGYFVCDSTFEAFNKGENTEPVSVLVIAESLDDNAGEAMIDFLNNGNDVLLVMTDTRPYLDSLGISSGGYWSFHSFMNQIKGSYDDRDTIYMIKPHLASSLDTIIHVKKEYSILSSLNKISIRTKADSTYLMALKSLDHKVNYKKNTGKDENGENYDYATDTIQSISYDIFAVNRKVGKGNLTVIANPILFTNFGIMDEGISELIFDMMQQISHRPVYRTLAYNDEKFRRSISPFAFFLSYEPLRWALYLSIALLCLFFIFTARRRQRVIPVIVPPQNYSLTFIKLIGTLYFQKHDDLDLVTKQYTYFTEIVRRKTGVDVESDKDTKEIGELLSRHTGLNKDWVWRLIAELKQIIDHKEPIEDKTMKKMIDGMRRIMQSLS